MVVLIMEEIRENPVFLLDSFCVASPGSKRLSFTFGKEENAAGSCLVNERGSSAFPQRREPPAAESLPRL